MVKAIYSLKMFLFQHQFTLTTKEKHSVKELALFVSLIYVQLWHEAPLGRKASPNDMQLLESLTNCPNRTIAKAARDTFSSKTLATATLAALASLLLNDGLTRTVLEAPEIIVSLGFDILTISS